MSLLRRHCRRLLLRLPVCLNLSASSCALVDANSSAGDPFETEPVLTSHVRFAKLQCSTKTIGVNGNNTYEERERDRTNSDSADEIFGKAKLPPKQAVDGGTD